MNKKKWTGSELKSFMEMIVSKKNKISDEMIVLKKRADEILD